ncbi:MAG: UDP-2,4-diacetamido-2,4,6-trideoxy-beta-L-altropyranose hydrolase, partial [Candidatus Methylumidiphilus sp.]
ESALKSHYHKLMVIDDLADRMHDCDVLLDQNMTQGMEARYQGKVPTNCTCLIGPQYSLLRPEFNALRASSLARRKSPALERLLICMGGSDAENETGKVIAGVKLSKRNWKHIDVVIGQAYPYIEQLKESLANLSPATLHIQTSNMAELMVAADWAVTAGGSMTWEKCVLGLPSLVVILGENQSPIATKMHELGAQRTLGIASNLTPADYAKHLDEIQASELTAMIDRASAICDGTGTEKVLNLLTDHL